MAEETNTPKAPDPQSEKTFTDRVREVQERFSRFNKLRGAGGQLYDHFTFRIHSPSPITDGDLFASEIESCKPAQLSLSLGEPPPREDAELEALITACMIDVEISRAEMMKEQAEIERLKAETRAVMSKLLTA